MRAQYLALLGLTEGASETAIKAAYRRLAKRYHPDRSPNPQAAQQFALITEAYDYLLSPATPTPTDPLADWRAEAREHILQEKAAQRQQRTILLGKIYSVLNYVLLIPALLNVLLIIDYYAPAKKYNEQVMAIAKVEEYMGRRSQPQWRYDRIFFQQFEMLVDRGKGIPLAQIRQAQVFVTPILHTVKKASYVADQQEEIIAPVYNIYQVFGYLIPGVLIGILIYFRLPTYSEHRLTLAIVVLIVFAGQMVLLITG